MKRFSALVAAAILGSVITVGTFQLFEENKENTSVRTIEKVPAVKTAYSVNADGEVIPLDFTKAAEKVMPAVVHIRSVQKYSGNSQMQQIPEPFRDFFGPQQRQRGPKQGSGSGVIINAEGYIVTNNHVIEDADEIEVTLHDNRSYVAEVIGTDPNTDLGLVKIKEKDLPYLPIVNSNDVKVGEWVLAVGNPFNLNSTVTAGIVSAKGRSIGILNNATQENQNTSIESFIQTDAAVNPGNSGGALTNLNGDLIGINTAIASPTGAYSGYSFAVPSNIVAKVIEDLMTYGVVQRGWLGVTIANITSEFARENDLETINGAYVRDINDKSGAKDAGIKAGDVIVKIDGVDVNNTANLIGYVGSKRPGDKVNIIVNRDGKEKAFEVLLKNREGNTEVITKKEEDMIASLGLELEPVDQKTLKRLEIESGVRVKSLSEGSVKNSTNMREGFIIT
ncbi:Do family serine endopeptidase, partial [Fulvivirga sp. RKSG066]|uniref:Do family serine endopeptidase n=1 Tax=Fulvivirga aurantia TaxID=2529383 RepID=UPI0012BC8159